VTPPDLARSTVWWIGGLFVACVLLQRFAVPGMPVALILPLILVGAGWGLVRGLAELNRTRLVAWLLAAGATSMMLTFQSLVLQRELVSVGSWALFMTVWLPFTLQLVDRRLQTYVAVLRVVVIATSALAVGCVVMMLTQYAGLPYRDWLAEIVPSSWLLQDFVITYPITYASPIYRANAWIGLEPSMVSLQMGVGLVAALLVGSRPLTVAILVAGLIAATSGSGVAILLVALLVLLVTPARRRLRGYLAPAVVAVVLAVGSPMGQSILGRLGEGNSQQSSTSLRAFYPYEYLWPSWVSDLSGVLFGFGPGSSQKLVEESGVLGLLVPTPVKIFYEYGVLAGAVLAAMMLFCFIGGPSRAIAVTLAFSLWFLQPGSTTMLVLMPVLLLVSWWAPRPGARTLESMFGSGRGWLSRPAVGSGPATLTDHADGARREVPL
jgi:hypothetical protein